MNFNFNVGFNKNKVDKLAGGQTYQSYNSGAFSTDMRGYDDYRVVVGQPLGLVYGFVCDGFYTVDDFQTTTDENGKTQFVFDKSGNYILKEDVVDGSFITAGSKAGLRPGAMKVRDLDGDKKISESDRTIIGKTQPKVRTRKAYLYASNQTSASAHRRTLLHAPQGWYRWLHYHSRYYPYPR